jgi:hypothetical protein
MKRNLLLVLFFVICFYVFAEYNCFTMGDYIVGCSDEICEFSYCKGIYQFPIYRLIGN